MGTRCRFLRTVRALMALGAVLCAGAGAAFAAPPVANFAFVPAQPSVGDNINFFDLSTGAPTTWAWDFGDGSMSVFQNPSYGYSRAGTFNVTLTASNASGSNVITKAIVVTGTTVPPAAVPDAYTMFLNTTLNVPAPGVLANDSDFNGDTLVAVLVAGVTQGTLTLRADGSFTYVPHVDVTGSDSFQYKVREVSGGRESSATMVTITIRQATGTHVVPVLVETYGKGGAYFSSELTLVNRGTSTSDLSVVYTTAASLTGNGLGTGMITDEMRPGRQRVYRSALDYLRGQGLFVPETPPQGGTLRVFFANASAPGVTHVGARTTAAVGTGRAGLAYPGVPEEETGGGPYWLFGIRQNSADRTNLAFANAGTSGSIVVRVTLTSADGAKSVVLDDVQLAPLQWLQLNSVLDGLDFTEAYAKVERFSGSSPFVAYAVFNDNVTNDGSYVPTVPLGRAPGLQIVPALVENGRFESELVLANPNNEASSVTLVYTESAENPKGPTGIVAVPLQAREQRIIPSAIDFLRSRGAAIGARGQGGYVGALSVVFRSVASGIAVDGFAGARTAAPAAGGGGFGLFYPAVPVAEAAVDEAWVYGLQQNETTRSNLALVNTGAAGGTITLRFEVWNGDTGQKAATSDPVVLPPGGWTQFNGVLSTFGNISNGYVRVFRVSGGERFIAYGVLNDGAAPGSGGTDDGSYVTMVVTP